jgi:predicted porin
LTEASRRRKIDRDVVAYGRMLFAAGGRMQKSGLRAACAATALLACAGAGHAADSDTIVTKAPVVANAPAAPSVCTNFQDFISTACPLTWYGVTVYGVIDAGVGWQTHGAPWDPQFIAGASYFLQKMNRQALWSLAPNGLSQSALGIRGIEPIGSNFYFIFQLEAGFDPYSLELANSPASEWNNRGVPVNQQTVNGDSSRAGQFYNSLGYFGVASPTYGTLTVFRQNSLSTDAVGAYDPMGASYAFSPIGFSGVVAGGGDTQDARYSTSLKYRYEVGDFHAAALWQFGGYEQNNGSRGAVEGEVGGDIRKLGPGVLSMDIIGGYNRDAVTLSLSGAPTNAAGVPIAPFLPQTMTATISDNTNVMAVAKYVTGPLKLYAGYEWMQFAPPSDPQPAFTDIAGNFVCAGCAGFNMTNINNTAFSAPGNKDRILQAVWIGARYAVTDQVDVMGAYYHYDQNNAALSAANVAACNVAAASKNFCQGTMDAFSFAVDWKFAAKFDAYAGLMFSQMSGGLANGFLARNNIDPTVGLRFKF